MFRSVRFFSLHTPWPESEQALADKLATVPFTPCPPFLDQSSGFEPPAGDEQGPLARRVHGADLFRLRSQTRLLPAAAVNEALEARIAEYRARTGEEPSRRARRILREQTRDELRPKALLKSQRTHALCLLNERIIAVGTAAESRAERFVEQLRAALGTLTVKPLAFKRPFEEFLHAAFTGNGPRELVLGRECALIDAAEGKSKVRWQDADLAHAAVRQCLADGMRLTHVALELPGTMSFVLNRDGVVSKLRVAAEDPPATPDEDPLARLDAQLVLLAGALRSLLAALERVLGSAR
ncbi:MAG TPA: recombination-associated protein RdgC [Gammaproteobacteria bacterium]